MSSLWSPSRLVYDHLRASVVVIGDGVHPSNTGRGYVLRRLIRRTLTTLWRDDPSRTLQDLPADPIASTVDHHDLRVDPLYVHDVLVYEERRFAALLRRGRPLIERLLLRGPLTEDDFCYLHDTHGIPRDLVEEVLTTV